MTAELLDTGVVVIARNEGERLQRCLASVLGDGATVVYADSHSTDGSVEHARSLGVHVVELDPAGLMNAPRGRNEGFRKLLEVHPEVEYVFFIDGDCQLVEGWLRRARAVLEADPTLGAVCGRRVEIAPQDSIYNLITDVEWNTPVGETCACGGDVLVRVEALRQVGGYNVGMSCGEDPEMCFRLREKGWRLERIEGDMTRHDVALLRFRPWWKRHARGGYAYAHGAALHAYGPEWFNFRRCANILFWGALWPLACLVAAPFTSGWSLLGLSAYGYLWWKVRRWRIGLGDEPSIAGRYAAFVGLGKFAEAQGVLQCLFDLATRRQSVYVEYKDYQEEVRA